MFARASDAYRDGQFALAISILLELRRIKPEPVLDYNLARAYEGLGKWSEAIAAYEAYLREDRTIADRGAIERRLETLRVLQARAAEPAAPPERPSFLVPALFAGAGLASVGAGFVFGAVSRTEESKVDDGRDQQAARDALDRGQRFATVANIAFVVGAALLVGGAVFLIVPKSKLSSASAPTLRF
jgi:hypothetical protein